MTSARKKVKTVSLFGFVDEAEKFARMVFYDQPKAWLYEAREKMRDLPKTNFDLGLQFAEGGHWRDALFRFSLALYLRPGYPQAHYNISYCHYQLGHYEKAAAGLKQVLRETPNHTDAAFLLASIEPSAVPPVSRPQTTPRPMLINFFTGLAPDYNQQEAQNQYRGGIAVAEAVKPLLPGNDIHVIDLGCGTGIASIPYRPMAHQMVGVDITPAIVAQALNETMLDKRLFDRVIEADVMQLGEQLEADSADLVLMVNVAQYVGRLDTAVASAARALKPNGIFALTVEPYPLAEGFGVVKKSGRFGHSDAYAKQVGAAAGLTCLRTTELALYPGVNSELLLFRKER